jgi:hypothetical protein
MSLARLFEAIESYRHYHYYRRECLRSNSVVVHSLNISCPVLFYFSSFHYSITSIPSFICPPSQSHLPKSIRSYWLFQMKGCTFGLFFLSLVIPLGEQIAEQGHVLNAVPGQWLVVRHPNSAYGPSSKIPRPIPIPASDCSKWLAKEL